MTRSRRRSIAFATAAVVVLLGTGVAGCGKDSPSGKETTMTAPSSGGAASPEPTDPGAGWHGVESDGVQLKAPPAWDVRMEDGVHYVLSTPKDEQGFRDGFATLMTGSTLAASTDELASTSRESVIGDYSDVERLDDVQFRGTKFFHIQATGESRTYDLYGALLDGGTEVSVHWSFAGETSRKKIDEYINEVMATFKFAG